MLAGTLLERLAEEPRAAALFLDIDGTLSPIASRPDAAFVPKEARRELARLVDRYALVACVTGRPSSDAAELVGVDGVRYVGEHGLELEPKAESWTGRLAVFAKTVDWPAEPGKRLTVSFHYRESADPDSAERYLRTVAERAAVAGLRPRWGKMVLEIRPPVDADKGTAVRRLLEESGLRRALYAGDDTTDLDGFRGLDGLDVAVRVAVVSAEAPDELGPAADLVVDGTAGLLELLGHL